MPPNQEKKKRKEKKPFPVWFIIRLSSPPSRPSPSVPSPVSMTLTQCCHMTPPSFFFWSPRPPSVEHFRGTYKRETVNVFDGRRRRGAARGPRSGRSSPSSSPSSSAGGTRPLCSGASDRNLLRALQKTTRQTNAAPPTEAPPWREGRTLPAPT